MSVGSWTYVWVQLQESKYQRRFQYCNDGEGDHELRDSQGNFDPSPDPCQQAYILTGVPTWTWISARIQELVPTILTCTNPTGDEEVDHLARDQEHWENDEEHDIDDKNGVHFPNVVVLPED